MLSLQRNCSGACKMQANTTRVELCEELLEDNRHLAIAWMFAVMVIYELYL
jgi:predicted nucleic acid-binding Zn ribbon protein